MIRKIVTGLVIALLYVGCEPEESQEDYYKVNSFIDDAMHEIYLWYDKVPNIEPSSRIIPSDYLNQLKYKKLDEWSFIDLESNVTALFSEGKNYSYGFYIGYDTYGDLRVLLVYNASGAYASGIRRGNKLISIDGVPVEKYTGFDDFFSPDPGSMTFEIEDNQLNVITIDLTKEEVVQNGVIHEEIFNTKDAKVGYIVYDSFLDYSEDELKSAIKNFKENEISELIVDLRYNGGGSVSLAVDFASMLVSDGNVGEVFYKQQHNVKYQMHDTLLLFEESNINLGLDRVFFITTEMSASASEMLINGLEPYMDVQVIGSPSHGKPVGMYGFPYEEWMLLPISFIGVNADGYGDYYDGLPVDKQSPDGRDKAWGDVTEPCLNQALHYISHGTYDYTIALKSASEKGLPIGAHPLIKEGILLGKNDAIRP